MLTAIYIAAWAFLFTGPMSEHGMLFGPLKAAMYSRLKNAPYLFNPIIGCGKCHAGQVALWWQIWQFAGGGGFDIKFIITAVFTAYLFEKWLT